MPRELSNNKRVCIYTLHIIKLTGPHNVLTEKCKLFAALLLILLKDCTSAV